MTRGSRQGPPHPGALKAFRTLVEGAIGASGLGRKQGVGLGVLLEEVLDQGWYRGKGEDTTASIGGLVGGGEGEDAVGVDAGAASEVDDQPRRGGPFDHVPKVVKDGSGRGALQGADHRNPGLVTVLAGLE